VGGDFISNSGSLPSFEKQKQHLFTETLHISQKPLRSGRKYPLPLERASVVHIPTVSMIALNLASSTFLLGPGETEQRDPPLHPGALEQELSTVKILLNIINNC
jgi:hypothetical protein